MDIKLYFKYDKDRINPLFYQGIVIKAETENIVMQIMAVGYITMKIDDNIFVNRHVTSELLKRDLNDKDITLMGDNISRSNWFEIRIMTKEKFEIIESDLCFSIEECLSVLNDFIFNCKEYEKNR